MEFIELRYHSKYITVQDYVVDGAKRDEHGRLTIVFKRKPGAEETLREGDVPIPHGLYVAEDLGDGTRVVPRPFEVNELTEAIREFFGVAPAEPTLASLAEAVAREYVFSYVLQKQEKGFWVLTVKPAGKRKKRFVVALPLHLGCNRVTDKQATLVYEHPGGFDIAISVRIH